MEHTEEINKEKFSIFSVETAADSIFWINSEARFLYANPAACRALGYLQSELTSMCVGDIDPCLNMEWWQAHWEELKEKSSITFESIHQAKSGHTYPVEIRSNFLQYEGREYICAYVRDITKRKDRQKALHLMEAAVERSNTYFYRLGRQGEVLYANAQACLSVGLTKEEITSKTVWDLDPVFPLDAWEPLWSQLHSQGSVKIETIHRHTNGTTFPVEVIGDYIKYGDEEFVFCFAQDISYRKEAEKHIQELAYYDSLTHLPNRALFQDRLASLLATSKRVNEPFAMLYLDLDRFKYINDSLGHTVGDQLLVEAAARIRNSIRESDTVSRIGGDEFMVLLPGAEPEGAAIVAQEINEVLSRTSLLEGIMVPAECSIGISCYPKDGSTIEELIKFADMAMYKAKERGGCTYQFFSPDLDERRKALFSLDSELRQATHHSELQLYYQPQVLLQDGSLCGAEALLRWEHASKGSISPGEFIPIAEDTGQIITIGRWVIDEACKQLAKWRGVLQAPFPISVNLSVKQLYDPSLGDYIDQTLRKYGLAPRDLELEVTEGVMLTNESSSNAFFEKMQQMGVRIAIDDFGTGYSSLSYLKRLPVNKLKIDKSFVRDITTDENDAAIVRSIIGLAHQFKLKVIAEGLETDSQLEFLQSNKCDEAQGFLISEPVPAAEFEREFLRA